MPNAHLFSVKLQYNYDPFGMITVGRNWNSGSGEEYRFGFNGMENTDEIFGEGNALDFGARIYDSRLGRFFSMDKFYSSFPSRSPYLFAGNTPISGIDINGDSLYIMIYVTGYTRGDNMFKAAAFTRGLDIESSSSYNKDRDKVVYIEVQDLADIKSSVAAKTAEWADYAGKTAEIGIWSHSGFDGPTGSEKTSSNSIDEKQMSMSGWSAIDFNFYPNGRAGFYGCNSANDPDGSGPSSSFITRLSVLPNFNSITISGQPESSYPSFYTNYRYNAGRNDAEEANYLPVNDLNKTYLVAVTRENVRHQWFYQTSSAPAERMSVVSNSGRTVRPAYQHGDRGTASTGWNIPVKDQ